MAFLKFLEPVLQLHEGSQEESWKCPGFSGMAPEPSRGAGLAQPLPEGSRENRAIPWNLPAQLFTPRGLLLSHELLYSKAKLSPSAEKVSGRQGPAGTDPSPSSAFPKGHQAVGRAFPMVTGQGKVVLPPLLCSAGLHITGGCPSAEPLLSRLQAKCWKLEESLW